MGLKGGGRCLLVSRTGEEGEVVGLVFVGFMVGENRRVYVLVCNFHLVLVILLLPYDMSKSEGVQYENLISEPGTAYSRASTCNPFPPISHLQMQMFVSLNFLKPSNH
jgi:hypothetical protein